MQVRKQRLRKPDGTIAEFEVKAYVFGEEKEAEAEVQRVRQNHEVEQPVETSEEAEE